MAFEKGWYRKLTTDISKEQKPCVSQGLPELYMKTSDADI